LVSPAAQRDDPGHSAGSDLRGSRLLKRDINSRLREAARQHGFDAVGIARPDSIPQAKRYFERFIAEGQHGDMGWLADTTERRTDPHVLWPIARAVIMLGLNYAPDDAPLRILQHKERGAISVYAQGDDYHDVI